MARRIQGLPSHLMLVGLLSQAVVGSLALAQNSRSPLPSVTAYAGATVIDGSKNPPIADSVIVVRGDRIVAIGSASETAVPVGASRVFLKGRFVVPGLINTHVHLASPPIPEVAKAYLRRELYSGVTTVRDMAGDARLLGELQREALRDEIASPAIYYSALVAGPTFFSDPRVAVSSEGWTLGTAPWMHALDERTDLRQLIAEAKGTGATGIKVYGDLPAPLIRSVTAEAHQQGMKVWAHAFVPPTLPSEVAGTGVDSMSHADFVGYEVTNPTPQQYRDVYTINPDPSAAEPNVSIDHVLDLMARNHIVFDATIDNGYTYASEKYHAGMAIPAAIAGKAFQHGVLLCTGTDDDPDFRSPDSRLLDEIERLVTEAHLPPGDVLRAATHNGAIALGLENQIGTLAVGKIADFVVLKRNPLEDVHNLRNVEVVVKHGKAYPHIDYLPASPKLVTSESR